MPKPQTGAVSEVRSSLMSRIKSKDTRPETILRSSLWHRGYRYSLKAKTPVGRPDLVIESQKTAVFIDGCFWHGCPDHYVRPRTRAEFWSAKLAGNTARDAKHTRELEMLGWRVVRVWEHEVYESLMDVVHAIASTQLDDPEISWHVVRVEPLNETGSQERRYLTELRGLAPDRFVDQARHTRKWTKPNPGPVDGGAIE